jgi:hypothetical protein
LQEPSRIAAGFCTDVWKVIVSSLL